MCTVYRLLDKGQSAGCLFFSYPFNARQIYKAIQCAQRGFNSEATIELQVTSLPPCVKGKLQNFVNVCGQVFKTWQ